jgi:hypothetical protein
MSKAAPQGWEGILDKGEKILWQGRPAQGLHISFTKIPVAVFGLFFAGFALFWMIMASQAGGGFWMFGLIHFTVGVGLTGTALVGETFRHRATWYTLTDRRAFIATDLPWKGRTLESYTIDPDTRLDYRAGDPASIYFARELRRGSKGRSYWANVGFERISGGEKVMRLLRKVQTNDSAASAAEGA